MIALYNHISGNEIETIEEMPAVAFNVLKHYSLVELVKPLASRDILRGKSRPFIERKYSLTQYQALKIGRKLGIYAPRKK